MIERLSKLNVPLEFYSSGKRKPNFPKRFSYQVEPFAGNILLIRLNALPRLYHFPFPVANPEKSIIKADEFSVFAIEKNPDFVNGKAIQIMMEKDLKSLLKWSMENVLLDRKMMRNVFKSLYINVSIIYYVQHII